MCAFFIILICCVLYKRESRYPKGINNLLELLVLFIRDQICVPALGEHDGKKMTPLFCTLFFFILGLNVMGLIPLFATATSNANVTGALAIIIFGFMIIASIAKIGFTGFLKCFVPSGVPWPVLLIIVPIEILGFFIKPFALTVRLWANMLAGHIVIFSFLGLVVLIGWAALPMVAIALFVSLLEVIIAFLQAFIFTFLSAIFVAQLQHAEH